MVTSAKIKAHRHAHTHTLYVQYICVYLFNCVSVSQHVRAIRAHPYFMRLHNNNIFQTLSSANIKFNALFNKSTVILWQNKAKNNKIENYTAIKSILNPRTVSKRINFIVIIIRKLKLIESKLINNKSDIFKWFCSLPKSNWQSIDGNDILRMWSRPELRCKVQMAIILQLLCTNQC